MAILDRNHHSAQEKLATAEKRMSGKERDETVLIAATPISTREMLE